MKFFNKIHKDFKPNKLNGIEHELLVLENGKRNSSNKDDKRDRSHSKTNNKYFHKAK